MTAVNRIVDLSWIMRMGNIKEENSECFPFTFLFHFFYYLLECPLVNIQLWKDSKIMDLSVNLDTPKAECSAVSRYSINLVLDFVSWSSWSSFKKKKKRKKWRKCMLLFLSKTKQKSNSIFMLVMINSKNFSIFSGSFRKL